MGNIGKIENVLKYIYSFFFAYSLLHRRKVTAKLNDSNGDSFGTWYAFLPYLIEPNLKPTLPKPITLIMSYTKNITAVKMRTS